MILWNKKNINKSIRSLHRDLGYLFIGLTLIYAISGILLVLKNGEKNPSYREIVMEKVATANLSLADFKTYWQNNYSDAPKITRVIPRGETYNIYVNGGLGEYHLQTGKIKLTTFKKMPIFKFVNDIHYNSGKRFSSMALIYAIGLIFFAISGAVMVKGKNGFKRRGIWLFIGGVLLPIIVYYL